MLRADSALQTGGAHVPHRAEQRTLYGLEQASSARFPPRRAISLVQLQVQERVPECRQRLAELTRRRRGSASPDGSSASSANRSAARCAARTSSGPRTSISVVKLSSRLVDGAAR